MVHISFSSARTAAGLSVAGRLPALAGLLAGVLLLASCASVPPPNEGMNQAQARLQAARDAGATDYDPVDLGFAQDKFQQAQAAMADRKYALAADLAAESRADADLARAKANLGAARAKIQDKMNTNAELREEGAQAAAAAAAEFAKPLPVPAAAGSAPAPASSGALPSAAPVEDMPAPSASVLAPPPDQDSNTTQGFQPAGGQP
ncbi:DUF4398 domain-containing protein [Rhodanobacter sp. DHB23]|uniref:DUF4398 domain-containing protein n=1 Tax=Rhodanobacter sp. DHB23 TaxID=2775923 RepID=UPI0017813BE0|nr:DUF4398 domain-containing protein [Rhodanobacter sp. DHB23]MBD8873298.1 DUF4398 domain-containing protein [Rhodanobacter sp. DHB23]